MAYSPDIECEIRRILEHAAGVAQCYGVPYCQNCSNAKKLTEQDLAEYIALIHNETGMYSAKMARLILKKFAGYRID